MKHFAASLRPRKGKRLSASGGLRHQGLCPWTPLGDFCPPDPLTLDPPSQKFPAPPLHLAVRLSCWCIVSTRQKISSNFFLGLVAPFWPRQYPIPKGTPSAGVGKICDFRPKSPFISETVQDRPMVGMDWTLIGNHRWRIDRCRFRWPWVTRITRVSRSLYTYKPNISKTVNLRDKGTTEQ